MSMKTYLFPLLMLCACSSQGSRGTKALEVRNTSIDTIINEDRDVHNENFLPFIEFDADSATNKSYILLKFYTDFKSFGDSAISSIAPISELKVHRLGNVEIFRLTFNEYLPAVVKKINYLIVSREAEKAAILFVDTVYPIRISKAKDLYLLSGVNVYKDQGFYCVFDVDSSKNLNQIFDSSTLSDGQFPVYNSSIDCSSYQPFYLKFTNIDLNNDGVLDVEFSGRENFYCKGLETGIGRLDKKPVISKSIIAKLLIFQHENDSFGTSFTAN